jgi:hypothetical protein
MPQISPESQYAVQPELLAGENILWAGQPHTSVIFHKDDVFMIPFSLMWGGFAIFWLAGASGFLEFGRHSQGPWQFGVIWGTPFVLVGQYMIKGEISIRGLEEEAHSLRSYRPPRDRGSKRLETPDGCGLS